MKVTMAIVSSVDGKTTRGDESSIYKWTSKEDQEFFFSLIQKNSLVVMGSKTYEAARSVIRLDPKILRVVITRSPEKYKNETVVGQLEFSPDRPIELIKKLEQNGYQEILLVGGTTINTLFLQERLVDEIFLTVEPKIFGRGKTFVDNIDLDLKLKLISSKQLNDQGTLLLHYKILY
jgi:dihydrofolate reductase